MADSFEELFPAQLHAFMVEFDVPLLTEEIVALIPKQRLTVGMLMSAGTLLNYTLSADRRKLWAVVLGKSVKNVEEELQKFPLTPLMHYRIHELMFHEAATAGISRMSLN